MARRRRSSSRFRRVFVTLLFAIMLFGLLSVGQCSRRKPVTQTPASTRQAPTPFSVAGAAPSRSPEMHLAMGNASNAKANLAVPENYLISRAQFAASYNRPRGIANWAAWRLVSADIGTVSRSNFYPDTGLPNNWYAVRPTDYTGTGYDRGHLVPSGDRTSTRADNRAVFSMVNIIPQASGNNQGPWERLESYCRTLARSGKELYIYAGGAGRLETIAKGRVEAPAQTWKVVLALPAEDSSDDARRATVQNAIVFAVLMPNRDSIQNDDWHDFQTTIDEIERLTGYDFYANLPNAVESEVESRSPARQRLAPTE